MSNSLSPFGDSLPSESFLPADYPYVQQLHTDLRNGMFWAQDFTTAFSAYRLSVLREADTPFAWRLSDLMTQNRVSATAIIGYISQEFAPLDARIAQIHATYKGVFSDQKEIISVDEIVRLLSNPNAQTLHIGLMHKGVLEESKISLTWVSVPDRVKIYQTLLQAVYEHNTFCRAEVVNIEVES